jgi:hypothetical protein
VVYPEECPDAMARIEDRREKTGREKREERRERREKIFSLTSYIIFSSRFLSSLFSLPYFNFIFTGSH